METIHDPLYPGWVFDSCRLDFTPIESLEKWVFTSDFAYQVYPARLHVIIKVYLHIDKAVSSDIS
jgi:hypothetical protein